MHSEKNAQAFIEERNEIMEFMIQNDPRFPRVKSPLEGKKALFCGDSITAAAVYDYKDILRWGWAGRVSSATGLAYINMGCDGASLSSCRGENRILRQINWAKEEKYDFVVLHGGVNDGWDSNAVGKMAEGFELSDFDTTTCAGGLEELLYYTKKFFPTSKIVYIVNYKTPSSKIGRLSNMDEYFTEILKILKKWNIPTLDLYNDEEFSKEFKVAEKVNTADFVHPVGCGYDLIYPYVQKFLESQV